MAPIVDAHVHLIDPAAPGLTYEWAQQVVPLFEGVVAPPGGEPWDGRRLIRETESAGVSRRVHVEAADASGDAVAETRYLDAQARRTGVVHALVVRAELTDPDFEAAIDRHREESPLVRGVRDMAGAARLGEAFADRALAALERAGLSWDVQCVWPEMDAVLRAARRHPGLPIVLGHAGLATTRSAADLDAWRTAIGLLAGAPNVSCKLSGLGMGDHDWTVDSWRPWVLACVEAFGADRCLFGSNWPVDRLFSPYADVITAHLEILSGASPAELAAIFRENATRFYRL